MYSYNAYTDGGIASYGSVFQYANARREDGTIRIIGPSAENNITTVSDAATTSSRLATSTNAASQSFALPTTIGYITASDAVHPETSARSTSSQTDSAIPTSTSAGAASGDSDPGRGSISTAAIAGICVSAGVIIIALCLLLFYRKRKTAKTAAAASSPTSSEADATGGDEEQASAARRQAENELKLHGNELYGSPADAKEGRQELASGVERHELDPGAERPQELGAGGCSERFELPWMGRMLWTEGMMMWESQLSCRT